jgi:hypothetical protein
VARTGHKGHPLCEYTSKAACEKARRIAIGQCRSMLDEDRQCPHWGIDTVEGRGYCGQHIGTIYREVHEANRAALERARVYNLIDSYLTKTGQKAHVCGLRCEFSSIPLDQTATLTAVG